MEQSISSVEPRVRGRLSPAGVTIGLTLLVLLGPYLWQLASSGRDTKFGFAAPDTFYYLTVARNVVEHGRISFDQTHATNAFHPLWQMICVVVHGIGNLLHLPGDAILVLVLLTGLLLIAMGVVALARAMTYTGTPLSPLFVVLPLGVYALGLYVLLGNSIRWATLWGYANGMESGVLLGLYGVLALAYVRLDDNRIRWQAPLFGVLCALFALARLDHAILPAWLLVTGFLGALGHGQMRRARFWLISGATAAALLIVYVLFNQSYSGAALPVSGSVKSSFPFPVRDCFVHTMNFLRNPDGIGTTLRLRLAQLVVPFVVTAAWGGWMLWRRRHASEPVAAANPAPRRKRKGRSVAPTASTPVRGMGTQRVPLGRYEHFLVASAWAVVFVFLYNFLFVKPFDQGFWYTPVSVLFVTLVVLHVVSRTSWHGRLVQTPRWRLGTAGFLAAVCILFYALAFEDPGGREYGHFYYVNAPQARAYYAASPPKLFSNDDGIVAYALGFPTMNAIGVMLDSEAARVSRRNYLNLFELAAQRGYLHFTSCRYTRAYSEGVPARASMTEAELRDWQGLAPNELPHMELRAEFISQDGLFAVSRLVPRAR